MTISFDDLDDLLTSPHRASTGVDLDRVLVANGGEAHKALVDCPKCAGKGYVLIGYSYLRKANCFRCEGKGQISVRSMAATKAKVTREQNELAAKEAFRAYHADVIDFLRANAGWSDFYRSMLDQFDAGHALTDKQIAAIRSGMAKQEERKLAKAAAAPKVDVAAIERLFATAKASGLKRPVFRASGLEISQAPVTGRNAGALYVKAQGVYQGKIADGAFVAMRDALASTAPSVLAIAADPLGQAKLYGRLTGSCSCCGRELTDPVSVANGIGPICASKWGI